VTTRALQVAGARVAIVDWDVHHGNGTQETFYDDPGVLYISIHQSPFYPGTGRMEEVGLGAAKGTTLNLPLRAGVGGGPYRRAIASLIRDAIDAFAPDWLMVSAGYDAHRADPLAGMLLESIDYGAMAEGLRSVVSPRRTVFFLEGGYDLTAIRDSVAATLQGAAGQTFPEPEPCPGDGDAELVIGRAQAQWGR